MLNNLVLLAGIAAIAGPLGYMIGGSDTPVVGVALPAVFGLLATAIGLFQPSFPSKEQLEQLALQQNNPALNNYLQSLQKSHSQAPLRVGLALLVFGSVYLSGTIIGTTARTHTWFANEQQVGIAHDFPWGMETKPGTVAAALEWLELQEILLQKGYSDSMIGELYKIQMKEWESAKNSDTHYGQRVATTLTDEKTLAQV